MLQLGIFFAVCVLVILAIAAVGLGAVLVVSKFMDDSFRWGCRDDDEH